MHRAGCRCNLCWLACCKGFWDGKDDWDIGKVDQRETLKYRTVYLFYMRTQTMIQYEGLEPLIRRESKTDGYTLDTCFLINAWKNPNIASYFKNHVHLDGKKIYINEVSIREAERIGYDVSSIILKLRKLLSVKIIIYQVTTAVRVLGNKLESCCQFLHSGDSAILAFAKTTKTILVTYDKKLLISCAKLNVKSLNPTKMMRANFA